MTVEQRLLRGLNEAAGRIPVPPASPQGALERGQQRRTRQLAAVSLAAVLAVVAVALGATRLINTGSPSLQVLGNPETTHEVVVFLCDGRNCAAITDAQRDQLRAALEADPAAVSVTLETKQDAYERFTEQFADRPDMLAGVTPEILPASFRVVVAGDVDATAFAARYQTRAGVEAAVVPGAPTPDDGTQPPDLPPNPDR